MRFSIFYNKVSKELNGVRMISCIWHIVKCKAYYAVLFTAST